jgi:hypothetical protein
MDAMPLLSLQRFLGKVAFLLLAAPCLKVFLGPLYQALTTADSASGLVRHSEATLSALSEFTSTRLLACQALGRWRPETHVRLKVESVRVGSFDPDPEPGVTIVFSDACSGSARDPGGGWGGLLVLPNGDRQRFKGAFFPEEMDSDIHVKEAIGTVAMLQRSGAHDCHVHSVTDSMLTYRALTSYHTRSSPMHAVVRRVVDWQLANNVTLSVEWIPSAENDVADALSRSTGRWKEDTADRMLAAPLFQRAQEWGHLTCTVDVCASLHNRLCKRFVSRDSWNAPEQLAVDCLAYVPDGEEVCWVHPPFAIISPLWVHLRACRARGLFVFPAMATQQWYFMVTSEATRVLKLAGKGETGVLSKPTSSTGDRGPAGKLQFDLMVAYFDFTG